MLRKSFIAILFLFLASTYGQDSDWILSGNDMYSGVKGNVGIGTTTPKSLLSVGGDGFAETGVYGRQNNGNYGYLGGNCGAKGSHYNGNQGSLGMSGCGVYGYYKNGNNGYVGSSYCGVEGTHATTRNYGQLGTKSGGVYGQTYQSEGKAVSGYSISKTGQNFGGYFFSNSTELGIGVYGGAINHYSGWKFGGYFEANGYGSCGVIGWAEKDGDGVIGNNRTSFSSGLLGCSNSGVLGYAGRNTWAGKFVGDVYVTGNILKNSCWFVIDHPLDPENKLLSHSSVESPENLLLYRGKATLNAKGESVVTMPDYFAALANEREATVTLTSVGKPFAAGYEWQVGFTMFRIYGKPNREVSWVVYADRDDPVIRQLARPVVEKKGPDNKICDRGEFLYPEAYGYPDSVGIDYREKELITRHQLKPVFTDMEVIKDEEELKK